MTNLVNSKESFTIETCDTCGAQFYNVMVECSVCGNKILTAKKLDPVTWRTKKDILFKDRVKEILAENRAKKE